MLEARRGQRRFGLLADDVLVVGPASSPRCYLFPAGTSCDSSVAHPFELESPTSVSRAANATVDGVFAPEAASSALRLPFAAVSLHVAAQLSDCARKLPGSPSADARSLTGPLPYSVVAAFACSHKCSADFSRLRSLLTNPALTSWGPIRGPSSSCRCSRRHRECFASLSH